MDILKSYKDELKILRQVEYNETLKANCNLRDTLNFNYPQVGFVDIRNHDVVIHINRPKCTADHGIEIYIRDDAWREVAKVNFKLNWLTSEIYVTETEYLDYLEVLGFIATEFKKEKSSFAFMLKSIFIKLGMYRSQIEAINKSISDITIGIAQEQIEHEKALFEQMLKEQEYFIKPFEKNNKRHAHVIYVGRVADKTVSYSDNEKPTGPDVVSALTNKRQKRVKKKEFYYQFRDYTVIDTEELRTLLLHNAIYNAIQDHLYWSGMDSLDAPFSLIIMLVNAKIIPYNNVTAELDIFITDTHKALKELNNTRYE